MKMRYKTAKPHEITYKPMCFFAKNKTITSRSIAEQIEAAKRQDPNYRPINPANKLVRLKPPVKFNGGGMQQYKKMIEKKDFNK